MGTYKLPRLRTPSEISIKPTKKDKVRARWTIEPAYSYDIKALTAVGPTVPSLMVPKIA